MPDITVDPVFVNSVDDNDNAETFDGASVTDDTEDVTENDVKDVDMVVEVDGGEAVRDVSVEVTKSDDTEAFEDDDDKAVEVNDEIAETHDDDSDVSRGGEIEDGSGGDSHVDVGV